MLDKNGVGDAILRDCMYCTKVYGDAVGDGRKRKEKGRKELQKKKEDKILLYW